MTITPASLQIREPQSSAGYYAVGYNTLGGATSSWWSIRLRGWGELRSFFQGFGEITYVKNWDRLDSS